MFTRYEQALRPAIHGKLRNNVLQVIEAEPGSRRKHEMPVSDLDLVVDQVAEIDDRLVGEAFGIRHVLQARRKVGLHFVVGMRTDRNAASTRLMSDAADFRDFGHAIV